MSYMHTETKETRRSELLDNINLATSRPIASKPKSIGLSPLLKANL